MEGEGADMSRATDSIIWTIEGKWLKQEGLWMTQGDYSSSSQRLKQLLFAWHAGSWYGAEVEEKLVDGVSGLLLSPLLAADYLAAPAHARLMKVNWSEEMERYRQAARFIHEALLEGWYAPAPGGAAGREPLWRLHLPPEKQADYIAWVEAAAESGLPPGLADEWLSLAAMQAINSSARAQAAWEQVTPRLGRSMGESFIGDEAQWWAQIGWQQDDSPFGIVLQLAEPQQADGWQLRVLLQSREEERSPFVMQHGEQGWTAALETEAGAVPLSERSPQEERQLNAEAGSAAQPISPAASAASRERTRSADQPAALEAAGASSWMIAAELPRHWQPTASEKLERELRRWLEAYPPLADEESGGVRLRERLTDEEAWRFLEEGSIKLLEAGASLLLPAWWEAARSRRPRLRAQVKSSVGSAAQPLFGLDAIVDFDWKLAIGDLELSEADFKRLAQEKQRLFRLHNEWVYLNPDDVEQLRRWMRGKHGRRPMTLREMLELHLRGGWMERLDDELIEAGIEAEVQLNAHLEHWLSQLRHNAELPVVAKPDSFQGELRPYQQQGLSWLVFLRRFGLGGCLADDMGLGKTIQFTAYLLYIKEQTEASGTQQRVPSLLICPTSVIGNWEKELERFAPSLRVLVHYGPRRLKGEEFQAAVREVDLVITSYALAPLDAEELGDTRWNALCLDEAQNIKNVYTKQSGAIRRLPAYHRLAMTGTPMENRLTELWSIHDFMNPGYLGSLSEFRREVVQPIERTRDEEMIQRLQRWVQPFMLRRLKKDPAIALSLPDKYEAKTYISLTVEQGTLYENLVNGLLEQLATLSPMQRRGLILATLTKLKQVCNHPSLLLGDKRGGPATWELQRSNKVTRLLEMVEEIAAKQERCLIFTQFIDMGMMLRAVLEQQFGMPVPFLHGGIPKAERDAMIAEYQDERHSRCAFVLSLKAGGTGLNLTAANHVFHFDRWWNPAVENQATDRAFRIGQQREVQVHKFVTLGTLEEKIDDMISRKQAMNEQVVTRSENWITELSHDELSELFTLRKTWLSGS